MSFTANRVLEETIREILNVVKPVNNDWVVRFQVVEELQDLVRSLESFRGATVEPYGSFVSNLFTRSGDLDISVELANGSFISSLGKKEKQRLLRILMRAMRRKGGWDKFIFVPHARVPILKVESNIQNIACDISVDNLKAQMKSKFLFWISEIDPRFRDMVLLVKEWAKVQNINNPKSGTFNSFSLSLLVVFHFQTCVPAIFPPLKDIYPGNISEDLKGLRANAEIHISETCKANIDRFRSDRSRAVNNSSLSELFISFLAKFSDISSRASNLGICPFTGKWECIQRITRWLPQNYAIFVEDPFEQPENSSRTVNASQMTRISLAFESSHNRLRQGNQGKNVILATLSQQQTRQLISSPIRHTFEEPFERPERTVFNASQMTRIPSAFDPGYSRLPSVNQGRNGILGTISRQQTTSQVISPSRPVHNGGAYQPSRSQLQFNSPNDRPQVSTSTGLDGQGQQKQKQQIWRPKSSK